ncbi:MAG: undecaprenyl-diphosphate phosphatase, partial [archaeon]
MEILISVLLGLVQGAAEWFPVSSSGHLAIIQNLLNLEVGAEFDIALHLGTILAVIVFFYRDIIRIFTKEQRVLFYIVIASIPTAIIGFIFSFFINEIFSSLIVVSVSLLITGTIIYISSLYAGKGDLNTENTFLTGVFQGLAVIPGISRSGVTISSLMFQGVERSRAATFSFLLAIPAVIGANILQFREIANLDYVVLVPGFLAAFFA